MRTTQAVLVAILITSLGLTFPTAASGQGGGRSGPASVNALRGPQVPLAQSFLQTVKGDYVAAGVGMRNLGGGTITITLPAGSSIVKAFLYWMIIREPGAVAPNTGTLNGTGITGVLVGTSGDPCWPNAAAANFIDVYRADVTGIAVNGANTLTGFPSGLVGNEDPQAFPAAFPLLEGASLVVVFSNALFDFNTVVIRDGAETFLGQGVSTAFGSFTAAPATVVDQIAQTAYIVGDGQARFAGDRASFNGVFVAGPGTALKAADAFNGADGIAPVSALDGLWDTLTIDVSSFFPVGVSTAASADVDATLSPDCLTWGAQVLSVKTALMVGIDIKPGSFPNSINWKSSGKIPVAILSTATFDAPTLVVTSSLTFGHTGNEASLAFCSNSPEDVNGDGLLDLVCHFNTALTGFVPGDTVGVLKGTTTTGFAFIGTDSVRIVGDP